MADASTDDTAAKWEREPNVVWRLGPDRVLVRRVGGDGLDLVGSAAMVWVALDGPRTRADLVDEISSVSAAAAEPEALNAALRELLECQLVRKSW